MDGLIHNKFSKLESAGLDERKKRRKKYLKTDFPREGI